MSERDEYLDNLAVSEGVMAYHHFIWKLNAADDESKLLSMENTITDYAMSGVGDAIEPPMTAEEAHEFINTVYKTVYDLIYPDE